MKAVITCKICDDMQPFTAGWELFKFLKADHKTVIPYNICKTCQAVIREKIYWTEEDDLNY